jgi:hypothetical protein
MILAKTNNINFLSSKCRSCAWYLVFIFSFFWSSENHAQSIRTVTATKTYTSDGTFTITDLSDITGFDANSEIFAVANVDIIIVGGGGGGGRGISSGGGGGGQVLSQTIDLNLGATLNIAIGQGGRGARQSGNNSNNGQAGGNTSVNLTSGASSNNYSANGGQGGAGNGNAGSSGNGNAGGRANGFGQNAKGGGGGGEGGIGTDGFGAGESSTGGNGGNGVNISITGSRYGAGGGGNGRNGGNGGLGGEGNGNPAGPGGNGSLNLGSGGGAGSSSTSGGNGSNGIVVVQIVYRILPVEFSNFEVQFGEFNRVGRLSWTTSKEWESSHFEIERAVNKVREWETIGSVEGNGYSDGPIEYEYQDLNLPLAGGNIFYRLRQVDFDGEFSFSDTKSIKVEALLGATQWRVFPNPTTGYPFSIEILDPSAYHDEPVTLRVISPTGQYKFLQVDEIREMGAQVSKYFNQKVSGVYTIEIAWGNKREYHKVILRR